MALTGIITTSDGTEHPAVFAQVYPLELQTIPGDEWSRFSVHIWHDAETKEAGKSELVGFPLQLRLNGQEMLIKLVAMGQAFSAVEWSADPVIAAEQAQNVIIQAIEDAAIEQVQGLTRAL